MLNCRQNTNWQPSQDIIFFVLFYFVIRGFHHNGSDAATYKELNAFTAFSLFTNFVNKTELVYFKKIIIPLLKKSNCKGQSKAK